MLTAEPKAPNEIPDVRLELNDYLGALSAERQRIQAYLQALLGQNDTPSNGWVVKGFDVTYSSGSLVITFTAIDSVAFDSLGRLVQRIAADGAVAVTLAISSTTQVFAYTYDVDSDYDSRRRYDRSLPGEVGVNDYTKKRPVVAFYADTSGSPPTHTLTPSGQTVPLVPIGEFVTDATGVTGYTDLRAHLGALDDQRTLTGVGSQGAESLRQILDNLATRLLEVLDATGAGTSSWASSGFIRDIYSIDLEVINARTSTLPSGFSSTTLQQRILASRGAGITVGDGVTTYRDYNGALGVASALSYGGSAVGGEVVLREGTYTGVDNVAFTKDGVHVKGTPGYQGTSGTVYIPYLNGTGKRLSIDGYNAITIEGVQFDGANQVGDWYILIRSASHVRFFNCYFRMGVGSLSSMIQIADGSNVVFDKCTFYQAHHTLPMVTTNSPTSRCQDITFKDCVVDSEGVWLAILGDTRDIKISGGSISAQANGVGSLAGLIVATTTVAECSLYVDRVAFYDDSVGDFARLIDFTQSVGSGTADVFAHFTNCGFRDLDATAIRISGLGSRSLVHGCEFRINASTSIIEVQNYGPLTGAASIDIVDCEFAFTGGVNKVGIDLEANASAHTGHDVRIQSCRFRNCTAAVRLSNNSSALAPRIEKCTFFSCDSALIAAGTDLSALVFSGNVIQGGGDAYVATSFGVLYAASVYLYGGNLNEARIEDNTFRSVGTGYTAGAFAPVLIEGTLNDVSVCGNKFFACGHKNAGQGAADRYVSGQVVVVVRGSKGRGFDFSRNVVRSDAFGSFCFIDLGDGGGTAFIGVKRIGACDNQLVNANISTDTCGIKVGGNLSGRTTVDTNTVTEYLEIKDNLVDTRMQNNVAFSQAVIDLASLPNGTAEGYVIGSYANVSGNTVVASSASPPAYGINLNNGASVGPTWTDVYGVVTDNLVLYPSVAVLHPGVNTPANWEEANNQQI